MNSERVIQKNGRATKHSGNSLSRLHRLIWRDWAMANGLWQFHHFRHWYICLKTSFAHRIVWDFWKGSAQYPKTHLGYVCPERGLPALRGACPALQGHPDIFQQDCELVSSIIWREGGVGHCFSVKIFSDFRKTFTLSSKPFQDGFIYFICIF